MYGARHGQHVLRIPVVCAIYLDTLRFAATKPENLSREDRERRFVHDVAEVQIYLSKTFRSHSRRQSNRISAYQFKRSIADACVLDLQSPQN